MTRKEFESLVFDTYNVIADYPFEDDFVTGFSGTRMASGLRLE